MPAHLTKHHGLGNDFLVYLTPDGAEVADRAVWAERARRWCHRHRGIGADGLLLGVHGGEADLIMTLLNADGSVAEMSGNGIRCLAQAEAMRRGVTSGTLHIATDGGPRTVSFGPDPAGDPAVLVASVDMGPAGPGPEADRPALDAGDADGATLALDATRRGLYDLGNPHLVLLVDDPAKVDIAQAGPHHEAGWSGGINVHVVAPTPGEADAITMLVWERGAGITEACGTGATAVARAVHDWGLTGPHVTVHMPGGDVTVDVGPTMTLHGPTAHIADIVVPA